MESNKSTKPSKKNIVWQEEIRKQIKAEKVELGHPKGKERFKETLKNSLKKKTK